MNDRSRFVLNVNSPIPATPADRIAAEVGSQYGFDAGAVFKAHIDLKIRWKRASRGFDKCILFFVSDYLEDAPEDVLRDIFKTTFDYISVSKSDWPGWGANRSGALSKSGYGPVTIKYLSSPAFRDRNAQTYRSRLLAVESDRLTRLAQDMAADGVVSADDVAGVWFGSTWIWGDWPEDYTVKASAVFKTCIINTGYLAHTDEDLKALLYAGITLARSAIGIKKEVRIKDLVSEYIDETDADISDDFKAAFFGKAVIQ